jgi:hypothetical protein
VEQPARTVASKMAKPKHFLIESLRTATISYPTLVGSLVRHLQAEMAYVTAHTCNFPQACNDESR